MKCPNDETLLQMSERSGIEIDYCPTCRGVWLDRGELDKIIERSLTQPGAGPATTAPPPPPQQQGYQPRPPQGYQQGYSSGYHKPKRKESWLSELFD